MMNAPFSQLALLQQVMCELGVRFAEGAAAAAAAAASEEEGKVPTRPTFPVDVFEKGACITQKIRITGDFATRPPLDVVRKFSSAAQPIVSPHVDHLKVVIQNQNAEMCIIGLLVLVGEALNAHIPTELHIMDRVVETQPGVKRWYQLPLTTEEILNSDRELVLSTLGSHVASNPPVIDQIEVFGMRKVCALPSLLLPFPSQPVLVLPVLLCVSFSVCPSLSVLVVFPRTPLFH